MGMSYTPVGAAAVACLHRYTKDLSLTGDGEWCRVYGGSGDGGERYGEWW